MEEKIIETLNEGAAMEVYEEVNKAGGNMAAKVVVGAAIAVVAGIGAVVLYRRRKNRKNQAEIVEAEICENDESAN